MLANHFITAWRTLWKNKFFSSINLFGLSISAASCLLIAVFVLHELSYDKFHKDADRIYRITEKNSSAGIITHTAHAYSALADALASDFPEIEAVTRFYPQSTLVANGPNLKFQEEDFYYADSSVFDVFSLKMFKGSPRHALVRPHSLVLTRKIADKFFPGQDPIGKVLKVNETTDYHITGVIENLPTNTHLKFDMLASYESLRNFQGGWMVNSWYWPPMYTYLKVKSGVQVEDLEERFPDLIEKYLGPAEGKQRSFFLQPVTTIHNTSRLENEWTANTDIKVIYILISVAALILLLASINYLNLAISRATTRASEVGVRKVMGAGRNHIFKQFLAESFLASIISVCAGIALFMVTVPYFEQLANKSFVIQEIGLMAIILSSIILFVCAVGGSYPAFFLSSFKPIDTLKGTTQKGPAVISIVRKGLVIVQFLISTTLIIGTLIIYEQLSFLQNSTLGFSKDGILGIHLRDRSDRINIETFKDRLLEDSEIKSAAASSNLPGGGRLSDYNIRAEEKTDENLIFFNLAADMDFLKTLQVDFIKGRNFNRELASDSTGIILNLTAWERLGWEDPLNKTIEIGFLNPNGIFQPLNQGHVIGVVNDFNYHSLHRNVDPIMITVSSWQQKPILAVRLDTKDLKEAVASVEAEWRTFSQRPFEFFFLDESLSQQYETEQKLGDIFLSFASLAIIIACLGLFALSSYAISLRTREIGIRKVLGASLQNITLKFTGYFMMNVVIAIVLSVPLSYWAAQKWLENFAYRSNIGFHVFVAGAILALTVALLTVGLQSLKAAGLNPVNSIKRE